MRGKRCLPSGEKTASRFSEIINENLPKLKSQEEINQEEERQTLETVLKPSK